MENLGALAILLAFCFSIYAILASVVGKWKSKPFLILSAERAVYSVFFLLTAAAGLLVYALICGRLPARLRRLALATAPCRRAYKFAAWWGGQAGSLLLWAWILSAYSAVVVFQNRRKFRDMMPYVVAILMSVQALLPDPDRVRRRARSRCSCKGRASSMSATARD